ncbi:HPr kinase/phosphorylase [Companilactobacillus sp. RD055328]|uniref:HPr(Ser) kinase/phosphatase n=1 Tax=Companilactobacillus sp. RD055328 TaxID=2916634 RepID=UPI001FC826AF|nr:HPr(Ser) kinase/phosphatase [Companilactobacillus sp. RD055328]GKQ43047.1 HPr kinase/phosphorylase [Companilactobacillus sp. RD055328]
MENQVSVRQLVEDNDLKVISGEEFLSSKFVTVSDISRPGIELTGYFDYYPSERIQLLGQTEVAYIQELSSDTKKDIFKKLAHEDTPMFLIARELDATPELIEASNNKGIPIIQSTLPTTRLSSLITEYLDQELAQRQSMHGVLVDIYGIGVLITGDSGVGKSETALELIQKGHRLIADDRVEVYQQDEKTVIGEAPKILNHLLEIRGVGIVDVMNLYGAGAVRSHVQIELVVNLEQWNKEGNYDRLGSGEQKQSIFDVNVAKITVPVKVGRNLAIIIEVAAMNFRSRKMGFDATKTFEANLNKLIQENSEKEEN